MWVSREERVLPLHLAQSLVQSNAGAHGSHKKRFAVRRKTSTDPDVMTTTAMLSILRAAVDSTIGRRAGAGAIGLWRCDLDFDCFLAAIINPLGGQAAHAA
jgi:hypothetical protein